MEVQEILSYGNETYYDEVLLEMFAPLYIRVIYERATRSAMGHKWK